jgi:hypothetical protein
VNFGIAFACIHAMKPVMARLFPGSFQSPGNAHAGQRIPDQLVNDTSDSSNGVAAVSLTEMALKDIA